MPSSKRASRLYSGSSQTADRLVKPFKCPGAPSSTRNSDKPARKRRKVSYAEGGGQDDDGDGGYTGDSRAALVAQELNRFPVFKPKDKESTFRQRFAVPLVNKDIGGYDAHRPAPLLGMRQGVVFVAKPLHDPCGEFAIVLYDPTVDNKPVSQYEGDDTKKEEHKPEEKPMLDAPIVHKSLADILGIKKQVEEKPKVPVVIDPRLAKVLRPHQVEGVKACVPHLISRIEAD